MSKVFKAIGKIASAVAIVASVIAPPIGAIAAGIATAANIGARITAPKPVARGSLSQVIIAAEPPRPYIIGETYFAGVLRHRVGYGATLNKVPNPYLWEVVVYSGVAVNALVAPQFDFANIGSYYDTFYGIDTQLGNIPESESLTPPFGTAPNWTSASKLSGCAAIGWNYKFDKDGKVFASGTPVTGAIWRGVTVYDPRLDSTFPGGYGACRLGDESTYVYSRNPALHAGIYAYGRHQNGVRVFGIDAAKEGIDWSAVASWANDCEVNEWYCDGVIFEGGQESGPEVKARNLTDICTAGGGEWFTSGAVLSFNWNRPRVALATITDADIMHEEGMDAVSVQPLRERFNTVRPQYRDPASNWELITAAPISGSTYVTEDGGEVMTQSWPLNMVKGNVQAGQLAAYALVNSREVGPWTLHLPAEWRFYRPGECLNIDSDTLGYSGKVVIREREFNPQTLVTRLVVRSETDGKHDFAMGKTAVPPPSATLGQTGAQRDDVSNAILVPDDGLNNATVYAYQRATSAPAGPSVETTYTFATGVLTGLNNGWTQTIPSGSNPLYVIQAVASSANPTDPIAVVDWSAPALFAQNGATGTSAVSGSFTNEAINLFAYANGNVPSYAGATGQFRAFSGQTDISTNFNLSTFDNPQNLTISYSGQTFTITGGFDNNEDTASITIRATGSGTYAGVAFDRVISLSKAKGGYEIVATLPTTNLFEGRVVFLTADDKLYRYNDTAWTSANPSGSANMLSGVMPGINPNRFAYISFNPDAKPYANNGFGNMLSSASAPFAGTQSFADTLTLPAYETFALRQTDGTTGATGFSNVVLGRIADLSGTININWAVQAGKTYEFSVSTGALRCKVGAYLIFVNSSGSEISRTTEVFNDRELAGGNTLAQYKRLVSRGVAPAGAVNAFCVLVKYHTTQGLGFTDSFMFAVRPMLVEALAGATEETPWSPPSVGLFHAENIVAGSITAAKLATTELITVSAQIRNAIITTAKIGDLQVETLKIAGNAVTVGVSAYSSTDVILPSTGVFQDLQTVVITTSGGPVTILAQCSLGGDGGAAFSVPRLLRNGVVIRDGTYRSGNDFVYSDGLIMFVETPPAGTHTYKLQGAWVSGSFNAVATDRFLFTLETKR